ARRTAEAGKILVARLPIYPSYAREPARWLAPALVAPVYRASDAEGYARDDAWAPGLTVRGRPPAAARLATVDPVTARILDKATAGLRLDEAEIVRLFAARDADYHAVVAAADGLRRSVSGAVVRYVVNRNINYTNICYFRCKFCAFSKGKKHE